jgi:hypothetical protein
LNGSYKTKTTSKIFRTITQVVRSGRVYLVRGKGIFTAIQRNIIGILIKIPKAQVTIINRITWGL